MPKTGEQNYQELKDKPEEMRDQLPDMYHMTRRFEKCKTVGDAITILNRNLDWDDPTLKIAYWTVNQKFGHLSIDETIIDNDENVKLKKEIQSLKMSEGRLKAQIEKLKEK